MILSAINAILCSAAQVLFQEKSLTGALILLTFFYKSPTQAIFAITAAATANIAAIITKLNKSEIKKGLHGYNSILIGLFISITFKASPYSLILLIIASILCVPLSQVIKGFLSSFKLPLLTAPFILLSWGSYLVGKLIELATYPQTSPVSLTQNPLLMFNFIGLASTMFKGVGQIMLQDSVTAGLLFSIAIAVVSFRGMAYTVAGSLFGSLISVTYGEPLNIISAGICGYNPALGSLAIGMVYKAKSWCSNMLWGVACIVICTFITTLLKTSFSRIDIPILTLPFVLAVWLILLTRNILAKSITRIDKNG